MENLDFTHTMIQCPMHLYYIYLDFTPQVTTETDKSAPVQTVKIRSTFTTGSSVVQLATQNNKDTLKMRKRSRDAGYRIEGTVAPGYESVKRMFEENFVSGTDER